MSDGNRFGVNGPPAVTAVVRVLIVDDHELLRDGLRELLDIQEGLLVRGEAEGENEALQAVRSLQPHLAIVDLALKQGDGLNLVRQIVAHDDAIRVIVCSMHDEKLYAERALRAGASGYVQKQSPARDVLDAIRVVLGGGTYLSAEMSKRLNLLHRDAVPVSDIDQLADRELEVLTLIGKGLMKAQIADHLGLSPRTVDTYRERIKSKLHLRTAGELNRRAVQWVLESE